MASRGGPRAAGSDGSDFTHREQVASRYQASTALKAKLKVCAYVNLFLCLPQALFIIAAHLGLVSLPRQLRPRPFHYLLLATSVSSVLYLASLPRNKKLVVQLANVVVVGCGLGGVAWGLYSYFWILRPVFLDVGIKGTVLSPMILPLAWCVVFTIKILLYSQTLYFARQLMATWDTKKTKKESAMQPSQVFASFSPHTDAEKHAPGSSSTKGQKFLREIQVSSTGEAARAPDRATVRAVVTSSKEAIADAKASTTRRLDYIVQTLHTHNVKEGDVTISKFIQRVDSLYCMEAEVTVVFVDFTKCQSVCNYLTEKLDESVKLHPPHFYHSLHSLEAVRRQACLNAVQNARQKALEVARLLRQALGRPLTIREEETSECEGASRDSSNGHEGPMTFQQRIANATFTVTTKVFAQFELVSREKGKQLKT